MEHAGLFLSRFKNLKAPERSIRSATIEAVREVLSLELTDDQIKVSGTTVFLLMHSALRAHVFQSKNIIISRINNLLGKEQITDVR